MALEELVPVFPLLELLVFPLLDPLPLLLPPLEPPLAPLPPPFRRDKREELLLLRGALRNGSSMRMVVGWDAN